ncbi:MAG: NAD(P)-dependent oxidoreductase [Proteobacteria bacterium]|nr:NAD(P)-dependent oxidoreductase [Pseudomonadota bacterium]
MKPVVTIIAPGSMGGAVGKRLVDHGIEVRTALSGRSAASTTRAGAAGMIAAADEQAVAADFVLSIVPPAEALPLAERLAPLLRGAQRKPIYVDCNAVSPKTVALIADVVAKSGCPFVDAGIIGGPPKPGAKGPIFYASGEAAARFAALVPYGIEVRVLDGAIGAASALKMSYAGITKGLTALAAAMMLAAARAGVADALRHELAESQPELLARFTRNMPDMYPKAYRWVAEMEEIAEFSGEDAAARKIFEGVARLYERLAADVAGTKQETGALTAFLARREDAAGKSVSVGGARR